MFPNSFKSIDGLNLRCHSTQVPAETRRGRVIIVHGLGDHGLSLPYRNLAGALAAKQFASFTFDWRGHGASEGTRMFANAWQDVRNDLQAFIELVQREAPSGPLFLIGLSLGGLLALDYTHHQSDGINGVVAVAPAVDASGVPRLIKMIIPWLSRLIPRAYINPGLDLARIARDADAVREYTSDPLFQTKTTPRLGAETLTAMSEIRAQAGKFHLPLLILHGEADTIVQPAGSAMFFEQVGSTDKQRLTYAGSYHNLFIEPNRTQVFADIVQWLERHT